MATTITKTVKDSGGDYTTLAAWEATENGDLVAADEIRVADCFALTTKDTTVVLQGGTTDATRYLVIQAHDNHNGAWNESAYYIDGGFAVCLNISQSYTRVYGIQTTNAGLGDYAGPGITVAVSTPGIVIERCIIKNTYGGANGSGTCRGIDVSASTTAHKIANCIVYGWDNSGNNAIGIKVGVYSASFLYNNTVRGCDVGIHDDGPGAYYKNNIVQDCTTAWSVSSANAASTNNCSDDTTHPGGSGQTGEVTFLNEGSNDFHLDSADTVAKGNGADLSADASYVVTVDIDNVTRSVPWDIGADQTQASAASPARRRIKRGRAR